MAKVITLGEFIIKNQTQFPDSSGELSKLISSLRLAAKIVNAEINKAGLVEDILGEVGHQNVQGEDQMKLDLYANQKFINAIEARQIVCGIASEEEESYIAFDSPQCRRGKYVILIDPLDGSSNIDVNVSIGTIFSIYKRVTPVGSKATIEDFLQPGKNQVAAGYIIYGSSTMLVYTTGNGVNGFTLDPTIGSYFLSHPDMKIPIDGSIYSVNEGNYPFFAQGLKDYLRHIKQVDAKQNTPYSSRYIGSLVSDIHRNILKGGIYMYPGTTLKPRGKLRLCYECNPMAYIMEQAMGQATDGTQRVLDIVPQELHERCPLYAGSQNMIDEVQRFL